MSQNRQDFTTGSAVYYKYYFFYFKMYSEMKGWVYFLHTEPASTCINASIDELLIRLIVVEYL